MTSTNEVVEWIVDHEGQHGVNALRNGILTGYSANGNNLIVENIMMNDGRNDSEYRCVIALRDTSTIQRENNRTILYVAGESFSLCMNDTKFITLSCTCTYLISTRHADANSIERRA